MSETSASDCNGQAAEQLSVEFRDIRTHVAPEPPTYCIQPGSEREKAVNDQNSEQIILGLSITVALVKKDEQCRRIAERDKQRVSSAKTTKISGIAVC